MNRVLQHQKVLSKIQSQQMAKTATVALVQGRKVVSHHANFIEANAALCAALDGFYGKPGEPECNVGVVHTFEIIPLSTKPDVGSDYAPRDRVWFP